MKTVRGIKIGGLQQKIFNLMLIIIILLIVLYTTASSRQQRSLSELVQRTGVEQQASIAAVSEQTMDAVLESTMNQTTALQAYIADDIFSDVRTDVLTMQAFATELFEHREIFSPHPVAEPDPASDGTPTVMLIHEEGAGPAASEDLALVGNMSEIMLAMYKASDKLSSVFVGTADGNMILVNDRASTYINEDGSVRTLAITQRPWYAQAAAAGDLIFTGVELDAYTDTPMLECAAPVYCDGKLVAVVSADIYLDIISDYVASKATEGSFICVVNSDGKMLFSPEEEGIFRATLSSEAPDLRENENAELAAVVTQALKENTGLKLVEIDGKEYFICGVPLDTVGWAVLCVVEKEYTRQPTEAMLASYDEINDSASAAYRENAELATRRRIGMVAFVTVLGIAAALILSSRLVKPLELMTKRINAISGDNTVFEMEKAYRTNDEVEILAESFSSLSKRMKNYIAQITQITAEKERIGTELALATRIQADMLPNIFPAFPERSEFDIYASMDPAKEVGGDFYDYFLIDDDHLCMVMADVSGKGVPAALFMMASKIILANNAMMGKSPAQILTDTNAAICSNNREEMFVTVWLGILEISTGRLTAVNAGHEYPVLCKKDGKFELVKDKHGLVVGALDYAVYREYELQLQPGDRLFVYTDGVPEATNADNELFGAERMIDALNASPSDEPDVILKQVHRAVDGFVQDAEQFDDLTMLCLDYKGRTPDQT